MPFWNLKIVKIPQIKSIVNSTIRAHNSRPLYALLNCSPTPRYIQFRNCTESLKLRGVFHIYLINTTVEGEVGRRNCYQQTSGSETPAPTGWIFLSHIPGCGRISFVATAENTRKSFAKWGEGMSSARALGACECVLLRNKLANVLSVLAQERGP